jgi:hypothetical protein
MGILGCKVIQHCHSVCALLWTRMREPAIWCFVVRLLLRFLPHLLDPHDLHVHS